MARTLIDLLDQLELQAHNAFLEVVRGITPQADMAAADPEDMRGIVDAAKAAALTDFAQITGS